MHNPVVLDSDDRDESVIVGCTRFNNPAVYFVFEDRYTSILGSMHDKRVRAVQDDVVCRSP